MSFQTLCFLLSIFSSWMAFAEAQSKAANFYSELTKIEDKLLTNPREALDQLESMQDEIKRGGTVADRVLNAYIGARANALLGKSQEILEWADPALAFMDIKVEPRIWVKLLSVLAEGYEFAGKKDQARSYHEQALLKAEASNDPWVRVYALNAMAWMENRQNSEKAALKHLQEGFALSQNLPKDDLTADLLNNLGSIYSNRTDVRENEAEKLLLESLNYFESRGKTFYAATLLYNLGIMYRPKDPLRSIEVLEKALKSSELIHDVAGQAYAHSALAQSYINLNKMDRAEKEAVQALRGFEETQNQMMISETWIHYFRILAINNPKKALDLIPEVEKIIHADGSTRNIIFLLETKKDIYHHFQKYAEELAIWPELYRVAANDRVNKEQENISRFTAEMDLDRKEHENQLQSLELQRNRRTSELKSWVLRGTIVFVIVLIACLIFMVRQMRKIRTLQQYVETNVLSRFLPPEIVMEVRAGRSRLDDEASIKRVTVFFCDLVDYTRSSEILGPRKSARVLNDFLMGMTEVVFAQGGTIDKFIGDAVMVIYGAPTDMSAAEQTQRAIHCARLMQNRLTELNKIWQEELGIRFTMRIGMCQGEAMVGTFGGTRRSDYTAIGTTVNLAARIETQAAPDQILISKSMADQIKDHSSVSRGFFKLKGITEQQELFEVLPAPVAEDRAVSAGP